MSLQKSSAETWRLALMSSGLGRVNRGYERFMRELYESLMTHADVTVLKAPGNWLRGEIAVRSPGRSHVITKALASVCSASRDVHFWERLFFALAAAPALHEGRFDMIQYPEPSFNDIYHHWSALIPRTTKRIFFHGVGCQPRQYVRCHHIQQMSPIHYKRALEFGVPAERMTLLPSGFYSSNFKRAPESERMRLRQKYSIPQDRPVLLTVAAINRSHKRIDKLIEAVKDLRQECHLILCGIVEDRTLLDEAKTALGSGFTHLYVPGAAAHEMYQMSDMFILSSLEEGVPSVVTEAALSGLPVILNNDDLYRWMLGPAWPHLVNMADTRAMTESIEYFLKNRSRLSEEMAVMRGDLVERFDWSRLIPRYLSMYQQVHEAEHQTIEEIMNGSGASKCIKN